MGAFQIKTAGPVVLPVSPFPLDFDGLMSPALPVKEEGEEDRGGLVDDSQPGLDPREAMGAGPELALLLASLYCPQHTEHIMQLLRKCCGQA